MSMTLADSYESCRRCAREASSNFYFSFFMLAREKRDAMCALYAFLRKTDDLSDNGGDVAMRTEGLARWRRSLDDALAGNRDHPLLPALVDTIAKYDIPYEYLHAAIDGVEMDLGDCRYETFAELEEYCYRVASVVGLSCIHIWGFGDEAALTPARACGTAFQLTNILRDIREDAEHGRIYLPLEDLRRFDLSEDDLFAQVEDQRMERLIEFQVNRAEELYQVAACLTNHLHADGQRIFLTMTATYRALLKRVRRRGKHVFTQNVRLGPLRKLWIAAWGLMLPGKRHGVDSGPQS